MLPSTPNLHRLPPPSSPSLLFHSFSPSAAVRRVKLRGGVWRPAFPSQMAAVKSMASQKRVKMVAKQIMRELSDMLLTDNVLQHAVLPEASLGADRYLSSLTTISDVEVSGDLQVVKVYVSVFGDERGKDVAIAGLKAKSKYVRSELGKRMKLRLTPEIRFISDDSIERGSRVIAILDKLKDERENSGRNYEDDQFKSSELPEEDEDPDEGIIYNYRNLPSMIQNYKDIPYKFGLYTNSPFHRCSCQCHLKPKPPSTLEQSSMPYQQVHVEVINALLRRPWILELKHY